MDDVRAKLAALLVDRDPDSARALLPDGAEGEAGRIAGKVRLALEAGGLDAFEERESSTFAMKRFADTLRRRLTAEDRAGRREAVAALVAAGSLVLAGVSSREGTVGRIILENLQRAALPADALPIARRWDTRWAIGRPRNPMNPGPTADRAVAGG